MAVSLASLRAVIIPRIGARFPTLLSPYLLGTAFLLLLLVSLSLPIIRTIYLFELYSIAQSDLPETSVATIVRFGVWGYCANSPLNAPGIIFTSGGECTQPRLGYTVDQAILNLTGEAALASIVIEALTFLLLLHPVSAGLSLIALATGLFVRVHVYGILSLIFTIITAIISTFVAVVDIIIVAVAKQKVGAVSSGLAIAFGPAVWMALVAAILLWIEVVLGSMVVCDCCGYGVLDDEPLTVSNVENGKKPK